ncbi:hypothetical protein C8R46DRAFT_1038679 [Mycena filopes]|nr:hypothetical protein C8R46DRAFT_1038679 [Mycena filopes]
MPALNNSHPTVDKATTLADTTNLPARAQHTDNTAIVISDSDNDTDTDSNSSMPEIVPTPVITNGTLHPTPPTTHTAPPVATGSTVTNQGMVVHQQTHRSGGYRYVGAQFNPQANFQTVPVGPSSSTNWRVHAPPSAPLPRPLNEPFANRGFPQGSPIGNYPHPGVPPPYPGRRGHIEITMNLILHLQRLERALQQFLDETEHQPWFYGH